MPFLVTNNTLLSVMAEPLRKWARPVAAGAVDGKDRRAGRLAGSPERQGGRAQYRSLLVASRARSPSTAVSGRDVTGADDEYLNGHTASWRRSVETTTTHIAHAHTHTNTHQIRLQSTNKPHRQTDRQTPTECQTDSPTKLSALYSCG